LYKAAAYGPALELLLWTAVVSCAAVLFIWSGRTSWWLAAVAIGTAAWLVAWSRFTIDNWAGAFASFYAPAFAALLGLVQPVLGRVASFFPPARSPVPHTGVFEREDMLGVFKRQKRQADSRIAESDLEISKNALTFGDLTVGSVMTPRRQVTMVRAGDTAGPMLMDELHKSGFSRFPVVRDSDKPNMPEVVGTLYLNKLIGYEGGGKIKDLASPEVYYINEDATLRQALRAFLKTHHHLMIVVNSFEEMAGVLSLEDVLEQILGKQIVDEFDSYENLRAVAAQTAQKEQAGHEEVKPEQTEESVVK